MMLDLPAPLGPIRTSRSLNSRSSDSMLLKPRRLKCFSLGSFWVDRFIGLAFNFSMHQRRVSCPARRSAPRTLNRKKVCMHASNLSRFSEAPANCVRFVREVLIREPMRTGAQRPLLAAWVKAWGFVAGAGDIFAIAAVVLMNAVGGELQHSVGER